MLRKAVPVVAMLLVMAGCASPAVEPPGLEATPSASPTPSPEPTLSASPSPGVEQSDLELGIVFEGVPELGGTELDVYNHVAWYQKEYWRMMTTNVVSPGLDVLASHEVRTMMEGIAAQNAEAGGEVQGVFHTRIGSPGVDGDTATVVVCDDFRDITVVDEDGTYTAAEVGLKNLAKSLTLAPSPQGTWMIQRSSPAGAC